jgi:hypothetical protein
MVATMTLDRLDHEREERGKERRERRKKDRVPIQVMASHVNQTSATESLLALV